MSTAVVPVPDSYNTNRAALRLLVRARDDFQSMRKRMDNRIGRKADGSEQNIDEREIDPADAKMFIDIADEARKQEQRIEKNLLSILGRFPIYNEWLKDVKGVGAVSAAWIIGEYDIYKASTVSKLWQFTGLNPGMVQGKKRVDKDDGTFDLVPTDVLVRGDKMTPGFVAPFNKRLRTALLGVMIPGFIKALIRYRDATQEEYDETPEMYRRMSGKQAQVVKTAEGYGKIYLDYKSRLFNSENQTQETLKGGKSKQVAWKDAKKGHRDMAARRYMLKTFLKDLYVQWRTARGLSVRPPYQEEYLGHDHED